MEEEKFDAEEYFKSMSRYAQNKIDIYEQVANLIIDAEISPEEIVGALKNISADTAWDVSEYLQYKKYLNEDEEWFVEDSLVKIYCKDFEKEIKNGGFDKRLKLNLSINDRIITAEEMFIVLHRRTKYAPFVKQTFSSEEDIKLYETWQAYNNTRKGQKLYNATNQELLNLPVIISEKIEKLKNNSTV